MKQIDNVHVLKLALATEKNRKDVEDLLSRLKKGGVEAYLVEDHTTRGTSTLRVMVGKEQYERARIIYTGGAANGTTG